jgi:hypothetical protein
LRRIKAAVPERNEHVSTFQELTNSLPRGSVAEWKESVEAWERGSVKKNPFEFQGPGNVSPILFNTGFIDMPLVVVGLAAVKLALLQQESQEINEGTVPVHDNSISHSVLITMGLDLEELQ